MKIEKIVQLLKSRNREDVYLAYEYLIHDCGTEYEANKILIEHEISVYKTETRLHIGFKAVYHQPMARYLAEDWITFTNKID